MAALVHHLTGVKPLEDHSLVRWLEAVSIACGDTEAQHATWITSQVTCPRCLGRSPPRRQGSGMPEKALQEMIRQACLQRGWLYFHLWGPHARRATPGFVDVVAVREHRMVCAELKRNGLVPTEDQTRWLEALGEVTTVETYLWTPATLTTALEVLR